MITPCLSEDLEQVGAIINDAALCYDGVIPDDCYQVPYMAETQLRAEVAKGVRFLGYRRSDRLLGVMGYQDRGHVRLIRHAYVRSDCQCRGIGSALIQRIIAESARPLLVGTWRDTHRSVQFYLAHGFRLVQGCPKDSLLRQYWSVPERQIALSVVLADDKAWESIIKTLNNPE
jgi:GNAT superfamily N-acetyltransferase